MLGSGACRSAVAAGTAGYDPNFQALGGTGRAAHAGELREAHEH